MLIEALAIFSSHLFSAPLIMKVSLLSFVAAVAMLASTQSFAAPASAFDHHDDDRRGRNYNDNRREAAERRKLEYKRQRKEAAERARWEAAHRNDRRDRDSNYGYDRSHRVTPSERARWEAAHRNDYGRR